MTLPEPFEKIKPKVPPVPDLPEYPTSSDEREIEEAMKEARIAWVNSFKDCFDANRNMFTTILKGFMKPFWLSIGMNIAVFIVGIVSFSTAMVLSLLNEQYLFGLIFGGIDGITFLAFFLSNPIKNLEKDMGFIAWLGLIYNTYWTRSYYATDTKTFQTDLQAITDEAVKSLQQLLSTHKELSKFEFFSRKSNETIINRKHN